MAALVSVWGAGMLAVALCAGLLWTLLRTRLAWRLAVDTPNWRSMHSMPVPRVGGWGLIPAACAATLAFGGFGGLDVTPSMTGVVALAALSFVDDRRGLPAAVRFAGHFLVAVAFVWSQHVFDTAWPAIVLCVAMVWMTNLYNFMDGLDGLAGGMALFGFATYAWVAAGHAPGLALAGAAMAGAALGFLVFNFPPARIFLGDAGSIPLGFAAAALGVQGWLDHVWPLWFPVMVFSPFIGDATLTLAKRLVRREKVWEAHREHCYQRLARMGFGHRATMLLWYALMAAASLLGIGLLRVAPALQYAGVALWYAGLLAAACGVGAAWKRFERQTNRGGGG
ncbi:glycosyltransferase family 4 protein [Burkholderia sp. BCC0405]|uniref:MraY family glycosyltransferase n=1 Tax=Burkholderia sp. BCC0405 TaxID=2676298 RepID=UPI00158C9027|nr:glycosyltransferase family 4 protein [Burkholderia sp. BCC0405]